MQPDWRPITDAGDADYGAGTTYQVDKTWQSAETPIQGPDGHGAQIANTATAVVSNHWTIAASGTTARWLCTPA